MKILRSLPITLFLLFSFVKLTAQAPAQNLPAAQNG